MTRRLGFVRRWLDLLTPISELRRRHEDEIRRQDELFAVALRRKSIRAFLERGAR